MSKIAGQLLWNRVKDTLEVETKIFDTGLCQKSAAEDPNFASRVMVIPQAPLASWDSVTIGEPYMLNGTVHVALTKSQGETVEIRVLFWAPHTVVGPVDVDPYTQA